MSNHLSGIKDKRKKIAEDIFHEIQGDKKNNPRKRYLRC